MLPYNFSGQWLVEMKITAKESKINGTYGHRLSGDLA
jgi:hypothetical protein